VRRILLTATALAMLSFTAYAQISTSGSASNATNTSGSQSSSVSSPRVTVSGNTVGNGNSSSTSGAKASANTRSSSGASANPTLTSTTATNVYITDPASGSGGATTGSGGATTAGTSPTTANLNTNYSGSYTVRNTPEVIAPNVMGGNPCAVGASGGIALPGFGLSAGTTWADKACERRQQAALMFNMGEPVVARELMCQDEQVRTAMRSAGKPCVIDTAAAHAPTPNSAPQAAASVPAATQATTPVELQTVAAKPEWCKRASPSTEASKAYFAQACT
jgi:hypothetical protein